MTQCFYANWINMNQNGFLEILTKYNLNIKLNFSKSYDTLKFHVNELWFLVLTETYRFYQKLVQFRKFFKKIQNCPRSLLKLWNNTVILILPLKWFNSLKISNIKEFDLIEVMKRANITLYEICYHCYHEFGTVNQIGVDRNAISPQCFVRFAGFTWSFELERAWTKLGTNHDKEWFFFQKEKWKYCSTWSYNCCRTQMRYSWWEHQSTV